MSLFIKIKPFLLIILCLIHLAVFAQKKSAVASTKEQAKHKGYCGFDVLQQNLRTDSNYFKKEEGMNGAIKFRNQHRTDTLTGVITLPVVFHIVGTNPANISDAQIAAGLQNLNDGFGKSGVYSSSTGVDTRIKFCFAKTDPEGGISNGITRTTYFFGNNLNPVIEDDKIKALVNWNPLQYINIWVIDSMELEVFPQFICDNWYRLNSQGYATMPPGPANLDGIVVKTIDILLIEQMGHYLGLYHTYEGLNCKNNDCTVDGDKVCDTPPDISLGNSSSCNTPGNSCRTDTLSGFTVDMPDLITNFMDAGNLACHNQFTAGQARRMRAIIDTFRRGLLVNKCNPPCNQIIKAGFATSINYPVVGNTVTFTNTSTGAVSYQWLLDGVLVATSVNFTYSFSTAGTYKITVKSFNGSCFGTASQNVIVNCGVTARFYTDKRQLASKSPSFVDTIHFTNNSENGVTYKWLMQNDVGMNEQVISTVVNLNYGFNTPGNYMVRLVATNGACKDTTEFFTIPVVDPDPNGYIVFSKAQCYQETKAKISFYVCNSGYKKIPSNIPITFYDTNPLLLSANKIGLTYFTPDTISGKCCSALYTTIVDVGYKKLNSLYMVFNDNGTTHPLSLPNTPFQEVSYANNISFYRNFSFRVSATPPLSIVEWGDTVNLKAVAIPDTVLSYVWNTPVNLTCSNCQSPILIADTTTTKNVKATSNLGCTDTTSIIVQVPPYNDFTVDINDLQCAGSDSLYINFTIANSFKRAKLPKTLSVSFYSGDPSTSNAVWLPPIFSLPATLNVKQATFSAFLKAPLATGKIYAVVNDSAKNLPVIFPNTKLLEKQYSNNFDDTTYFYDSLKLQPSDTTVLRKQIFPLQILTPIYNPATTLWSSGSNYTLSCNNCSTPQVQVFNNASVPVHTANRYGCLLYGAVSIHILDPDMVVQIKDVKCVSNNTITATFTICLNNNYDSVFAGIPVAFYDANPDSGIAHLLGPVFYTPTLEPGNCKTYTTNITTTTTGKLYAVVNDNGSNINSVPNNVFGETNFTNNFDDTSYVPFSISAVPNDTSIQRLSSIQLNTIAQGGVATSYAWSPSQFLSCSNCANPIASPRFTIQYLLTARNETNCTDTALVIIKTNTKGVNIPDAFTPNNDGLNDWLYVIGGKDIISIKSFLVYNRWGQKVFETINSQPNLPTAGWNGKINSGDAEPGTYVYAINIAFANGTEKLYKGTVVLIR